jgi:Terminase RNaseH-like domain/Terminase large subunit, T4likevirus-type, N-terminal
MNAVVDQVKKYLGNPKLKRVGVPFNMTQEQIDEYVKCSEDPAYFAERYVKIITLDHGLQNIKLYPFQQEALHKINKNRQVIVKAGRQVGKTTMVVGYILWYILFNQDKLVAILANKAKTAREILSRVKIAYEELPHWIQQGVKTWNKGDIELENNSRVLADSTASSAIRGFSISLLYLDEFAFVPNNIAEEFFTSVYPTITSGTSSKILISSTPNGMNHYYKMWNEAVENKNGFVTIEANWRQVPGRTEEWAKEQQRVLGDEKYLQEMECEFQGSIGTLISGMVLKSLTFRLPKVKNTIHGLSIHQEPIPGHKYVITVDTSRGKGLDYSAFVVIDVTEIPYRIVCKYKDNEISPVVYPSIVAKIGRYYNDAYILVEINDNGQQISDSLFDDFEYENILSTAEQNKKITLTWAGGGRAVRGIRTTKSTKRLGCSLMKSLIESYKLIVEDFDIIAELSTFINKSNSYEADEGSHDDLVMCLVLFSWMTNQPFFSDLCNTNIKDKLYRDQMKQIEEDMLPIPLSGDEYTNAMLIEDGSVWEIVK